MNVFTYTKGVNAAIRTQIIEWSNKNQEYLRLIYDGDIFRAQGTAFGDCISKVEYLIEMIFTEPQYFRLGSNFTEAAKFPIDSIIIITECELPYAEHSTASFSLHAVSCSCCGGPL